MLRPRPRFLVAALVLLLAACSGTKANDRSGQAAVDDPQPPPECPVHALDDATDTVEVTAWAPFTDEGRRALDDVVARYDASQTRVKVTVTDLPSAPAEQRARYADAARTGSLPALVALDATELQYVADTATTIPAAACFDAAGGEAPDQSSVLPAGRAYFSIDKKQQVTTANLSTVVLYYRRAAFAQAGLDPTNPPRTLDDLAAAARQLRDRGVSTTPLALPVDPVIVENWLNGAGVQIVDHGNGRQERAERATLDDPRAERIYEWLRTMGQERLLQPMGGVTADSTLPGSTLSTASGTSAPVMTIASSTTITGVAPTSVEGAPDLDVAPLPGLDNPGRGQIGGVGWYLVRSDRPEVEAAAWDFLRFLDTQASQITFNVRGSYLPFDVRTIDDPALQAVWQSSRRGPWLDTAYTQLTNMDPSSPGPLIGPYDETQDAIRQSIEAVLAGGQPAAVLATANVAIDAALAAYRVPPP